MPLSDGRKKMLKHRDVEVTLYKLVRDMYIVPENRISLPNKKSQDQSHPRIELERPSVVRPLLTVSNKTSTETGTLAVIFIGEKDSGSKQLMELADRLCEALPKPQNLVPLPNEGWLQIRNAESIGPGYADYGSWRLPVMVEYHASIN